MSTDRLFDGDNFDDARRFWRGDPTVHRLWCAEFPTYEVPLEEALERLLLIINALEMEEADAPYGADAVEYCVAALRRLADVFEVPS